MGFSTLQSYRGAQVFECIGLNETVVDRYFTGTSSRISGTATPDRLKIRRPSDSWTPGANTSGGATVRPTNTRC
ncbi:MAG: glutamate synthase central domain-containing protein [Deltaproteobacteria bacterium]|nr:glutamate synthase central domain-containing protein [Deltaproteobacteria bacterium]